MFVLCVHVSYFSVFKNVSMNSWLDVSLSVVITAVSYSSVVNVACNESFAPRLSLFIGLVSVCTSVLYLIYCLSVPCLYASYLLLYPPLRVPRL